MTQETKATLELSVGQLRQLYNAMDPAPFRERDLDPNAVTYILDWARETDTHQPLDLVVHVGASPASAEEQQVLSGATHDYFQRRAASTRLQLRRMFRTGRISLVIGIAFVAVMAVLARLLSARFGSYTHGWILSESLVIAGWVALWRPMEIFLYDWWPLHAEKRLFERLAKMPVRVNGGTSASAGAA